jgi:hypothetical protein
MASFLIDTNEYVTGTYLVSGVADAEEAKTVLFAGHKGMPNFDDDRVEQIAYSAYCVEPAEIVKASDV